MRRFELLNKFFYFTNFYYLHHQNLYIMKNYAKVLMLSTVFSVGLNAQTQDQMTKSIMDETYNNSQLEKLAYELLDGIGPRLVGSPKMQQSHDWAVSKFKSWGIDVRNEQWGEWKSWERGTMFALPNAL